MTEKRFIDDGFEAIEDQSFTDTLTKKTYYVEYFDEVVDLCNSLWEQTQRFEKHNKDLMEENEQLKQTVSDWSGSYDELFEDVKRLEKENEQLKQRNENQYNQLTEVWGLIHRREWEILVDMDNKMKEDEERLQQEWKCYE